MVKASIGGEHLIPNLQSHCEYEYRGAHQYDIACVPLEIYRCQAVLHNGSSGNSQNILPIRSFTLVAVDL